MSRTKYGKTIFDFCHRLLTSHNIKESTNMFTVKFSSKFSRELMYFSRLKEFLLSLRSHALIMGVNGD